MGTPLKCEACGHKFWSTADFNESGWTTNCMDCYAHVQVDDCRVDPSEMPDDGVVWKNDITEREEAE